MANWYTSRGYGLAVITYPLSAPSFPSNIIEMFVVRPIVSTLILFIPLFVVNYLIYYIIGSSLGISLIWCISQLGIWLIIGIFRNQYKINQLQYFCPLIFWIYLNYFLYYPALSSSLILWNFVIIVHFSRTNRSITHPTHVRHIGRALRTIDEICRKSNLYDSLVLSGHSAGGHLCSLITFQEEIQSEFDLDFRDLKVEGVILLSGVYDLVNLSKNWLIYQIYVKNQFTKEEPILSKASPINYITKKSNNNFPLLFINANYENILLKQTKKMVELLRENDFKVEFHHFQDFNHFDIVQGFHHDQQFQTIIDNFISTGTCLDNEL